MKAITLLAIIVSFIAFVCVYIYSSLCTYTYKVQDYDTNIDNIVVNDFVEIVHLNYNDGSQIVFDMKDCKIDSTNCTITLNKRQFHF